MLENETKASAIKNSETEMKKLKDENDKLTASVKKLEARIDEISKKNEPK